ncbi:MAG: FtsW/RodA/SpoVE family cell cycle protein [Phycisphaerae bacterium]
MRRLLPALSPTGWGIVLAVMILYGVGLASICATEGGLGDAPFAGKQVLFLVISLTLFWGIVRTGFQRISGWTYVIGAGALLLLVPPAVARVLHTDFGGLVPNIRGAHRWIMLPGFRFQPSELMKVIYILTLAWYLRYRRNYRTIGGLLLPLVGSAVPLFLILLEPDLGTALLMIPVLFAMLFLAGARVWHLLLLAGLAVVIAPLLWLQMRPYQRLRITSVLLQSDALRSDIHKNPQDYRFLDGNSQNLRREARQWRNSSGMQLVRSKAALGSGGVLGQGWGHGTYVEYNFLPDRHNDFVFALIGHQWGLGGCLGVLGCYVVIVLAGMNIALRTTDPVGRLLAAGVVTLIACQVLINVGMCIGLMPVTGMTLPFVSYGGSSLLVNFMALGLLVSVGRHRPFMLAKPPFEFGDPAASFPPRPDRPATGRS